MLQRLINARGRCGQEDEVRELLLIELSSIAEKVWEDPAGNVVAKIVETHAANKMMAKEDNGQERALMWNDQRLREVNLFSSNDELIHKATDLICIKASSFLKRTL